MWAGFEPKRHQGFEVFAQKLASGLQNVRGERRLAHHQFRSPLLKKRQVRVECVLHHRSSSTWKSKSGWCAIKGADPTAQRSRINAARAWGCSAKGPRHRWSQGSCTLRNSTFATESHENCCSNSPSRDAHCRSGMEREVSRAVCLGPIGTDLSPACRGFWRTKAVQEFAQRLIPEVEQVFLSMKSARSNALSTGSTDQPQS